MLKKRERKTFFLKIVKLLSNHKEIIFSTSLSLCLFIILVEISSLHIYMMTSRNEIEKL